MTVFFLGSYQELEEQPFKSAALGHKLGWAALTKKVSTGASGKLHPGLMYGLGKGAIEAVQKWDKPWEGIQKESKYPVKAAW